MLVFKGDMQPLDVCCVKRKKEVLRYSVVMAAYGFFGDVMQDSEKLRWMGPKRYDVAGFKKFMSNRYTCTYTIHVHVMCISRKYPYSPQGRFSVLHLPSPQEIPGQVRRFPCW